MPSPACYHDESLDGGLQSPVDKRQTNKPRPTNQQPLQVVVTSGYTGLSDTKLRY